MTLKEKAKRAGLNYGTVTARINTYGWSEEKALSTPARKPELNEDVIGKVYWDNLLVLSDTGRKTKDGRIIVNVLCLCGGENCKGEFETRLKDIKSGNTKTCSGRGQPLRKGEAAFNALYQTKKLEAQRHRGIPFSLTKEQMRTLLDQPCFYCGSEELTCECKRDRMNGSINYQGFDQLYAGRGYDYANTVPCCPTCNMKKGTKDWWNFIEREGGN